MYRILVPLDGSDRAERAIPWADELAGALGAQVELLRVVGPNDLPDETASDAFASEIIGKETSTGRATLELEAKQFAKVTPVQQDVVLGEPGPTITERAHANQADLIVMASHGRTDFQRTLLGSVADEVIRESHVPVLIIRDDLPSLPRLPERVLVPLDGSELSEAVLPYIMPLAQQLGWSLVLLWQVDYPPQSIPVQGAVIPLDFVAERGDAEMVAYLNRVANDLQAKGISAEPRVWFGAKAQSIVEFASQEQMDLIAMSTHGRKGFGRWLRGSTTDYILTHATIPVLTVRPPAP